MTDKLPVTFHSLDGTQLTVALRKDIIRDARILP